MERRSIAGDTRQKAQGRWREILPALGIPTTFVNGKHQGCPMCGGKDRARFDDKDGNGSFICGQCGAGSGFHLLQKFHGWTFRQAADEIDKIIGNLPPPKPKREQQPIHWVDIAQLWRKCRQVVTADPVGTYLRARGVDVVVWPKALRFAPTWRHTSTQQNLPCMMALYRSADGKLGTVHRTYLAEVTPRRMFLPGRVPKGGAVRLFEPDRCMGVAEGIETALSAGLLFRLPVWACCTQGLLREWQPPPDATHITVFGDNDSSFVGQAAAYELAWRLARDGYRVAVKIPEVPDWDWNDVLKNEIETERYPSVSELRIRDEPRGPSVGQSLSTS